MSEYKIDVRFGPTLRNWRKGWFWRPTASYGHAPLNGVKVRQLGVRVPGLWLSVWACRVKVAA